MTFTKNINFKNVIKYKNPFNKKKFALFIHIITHQIPTLSHYSKNKLKSKYVCVYEITRFIIIEIKMKMKKDHTDTI